MESIFWGESENAFFSFDDLDNARKIKIPLYPRPYYALLNDSKYKYEYKQNGEIRLLGMDIATQGGSKNDATCFSVLQLIPSGNNQFIKNLIYMETLDGGHTADQAIRARQLYDDFDIDYIVIDTNGVGIGVFDNLVQDLVDSERNIIYTALGCINDDKMHERCKNPSANKVIYSIKANQEFNNNSAVMIRDAVKRGILRLLINESDANEILEKNKSFQKLSPDEQVLFQAPYHQTSALITEMVNLDYEVTNGKIKVKENSGMRKDRYSSTSMALSIANEIERKTKDTSENDISNFVRNINKINSPIKKSNLVSKIFR